MRISIRTFAAPVLILALFTGCTVGPDFERPEDFLEPSWYQEERDGLTSSGTELVAWWEVFGDPRLNRLVEEAHRANNNLEIAAVRILEARAQLGIASGLRWPQSQVAVADATYAYAGDERGVGSRARRQRRVGGRSVGALPARNRVGRCRSSGHHGRLRRLPHPADRPGRADLHRDSSDRATARDRPPEHRDPAAKPRDRRGALPLRRQIGPGRATGLHASQKHRGHGSGARGRAPAGQERAEHAPGTTARRSYGVRG